MSSSSSLSVRRESPNGQSLFFSSKKYSRYIYIYKKRKRRNYCYASVHIPMSACYEPLWYGQLPVMREDYCYYWWLSCDRSFVWPHYYWTCAMLSTSSDRILYVIIGKESQFVVYQRILMIAIMVKSFKDISTCINIKTFNFFFLAEFIIFFFQFGFKGIIVLSGN